jgi:hypothetical protein
MKLSRTGLKYLVDTLMFLCILGVAGIGFMMGYAIPEGPGGGGGSKFFLGIHRHQWGNIHLYLSLAFTALLVVHLVLSWSWIKGKARSLFGKAWKAALGLTLLAALLVPFLFWLAMPKNDPAYAEYGAGVGLRWRQEAAVERAVKSPQPAPEVPAGAEPRTAPESAAPGEAPVAAEPPKAVAGHSEAGTAEVVITGQMSLRDVERATGVPAQDIIARLDLPPDVPLDEMLGRLRRRYGFEIEQVRVAVADLLKK